MTSNRKQQKVRKLTPKEYFMRKIQKSMSDLSIGWLDAQRVIEVVDENDADRLGLPDVPPIAAWVHGSGRDRILMNIAIRGLTYTQLRLVVMHEALHRCGLASTHLANKHPELANIVFDAIINKILFNSGINFDALIGSVYKPDRVGNGLLRLVLPGSHHLKAVCADRDRYSWNPVPPGPTGSWEAMTPKQLQLYGDFEPIVPKFKDVWNSVWKEREMPNAMSIFYRLLATAQEIEVAYYTENNPFGGRHCEAKEGDTEADAEADGGAEAEAQGERDGGKDDNGVGDDLQKIAKDNEKYFSFDRAYCNAQTSLFNKLYVLKEDVEAAQMKQFILQMETQQKMSKFLDDISTFADRSSRDPYVIFPTPETITLMACGVTDYTKIYYNNEGTQLSKFAAYIDTSPSMDPFRAKMVGMVDAIQDIIPTEIFTFGGSVYPVSTEEFVKGNYHRHTSTYFNCVIEHLLKEELEGAVIFTDGYSDVTAEWQDKFRKAGKKLFVVYYHETDKFEGCRSLNAIAEATHLFTLEARRR
jgi:hypothetical protein